MFTILEYANFDHRNFYYIKIESKRERDEAKLRELGLYPKNLEIMRMGSNKFYKHFNLYTKYINEQDIENLNVIRKSSKKAIGNWDWEEFIRANENLHADFIIGIEFRSSKGSFRIINRTYKNLYKLSLQPNTDAPRFPYAKPKNAEEKLYYEKCLALNIKFDEVGCKFPTYITMIHSYVKLINNILNNHVYSQKIHT